ncbi:thiamine-phosphate diphosphorylase [Nitrosospira sp. Nsp2]|uniref:thiamine phosphate synthase n=1 Tax=Nitrosospira sp. Nsp2 TaxID=136548 RepID=UPI000D3043E2|nr:thiamine phosphate synthase [Nitrosospira sp. Nsp2]PTR15455.1 thiamine-phosphate diphosphorylase [Nitrosospira sp. Nsp2]
MPQAIINGLYALTPDVADTPELIAMARQALEGGARLVQYRNKAAGSELRREQAHALARLCRAFQVPFVINDHLDLAIEVSADGVHLGREDTPLTDARRLLGQGKIIGISCYDRLELAAEAEHHRADYVAFGAFFASVTKPGATPAAIDLLNRAKQELKIPVVAIGGITYDNAADLIRRGADAVAVSNALFHASDIRAAAEDFSRLIKQNKAKQAFHSSPSWASQ